MGTFEIMVWMTCIAIVVGLFVGGIAAMIGMAAEIYEEEVRRLRRWLRQRWRSFLGEREGAVT